MSDENRNHVVIIFKVLAVLICVYPLFHYTFLQPKEEPENHENQTEIEPDKTRNNPEGTVKIQRIVYPSCPISYTQIILQDICKSLHLKHHQCTPDDFHDLEKHKLPRNHARNNTSSDPRGTIVGCVAAGLLLTSLGAAFLELYKAKSQTPAKNTKPMLTRKCSLADLTVLKHNRKELIRRESILEIPENGGSVKQLGRKVSRPPLRLD